MGSLGFNSTSSILLSIASGVHPECICFVDTRTSRVALLRQPHDLSLCWLGTVSVQYVERLQQAAPWSLTAHTAV